jgi:hypothetical protein
LFEALCYYPLTQPRKQPRLGDSLPDAELDPAELAAYMATAGVILNLDETITKE